LIDVNTRDNQLRQLAVRRGGFIEGRASIAMQAIAHTVAEAVIAVDRWPSGFSNG
jgi:hypothetical protein